jgi:dihydrolipoamide dehydrogenase
MSELRVDAVVIGSGPGGYPAGIRLGQLKVKTVVVEKEYMGGVCLNVGCIPSKAVIHAAKTFDKIGHADEIGISVGKPTIDMKKLQAWKGGVVSKLTGGVKTLIKGNGSEIIMGTAKLAKSGPDGHRVVVTGKDGTTTIIAKNVVIATGSRPFEIPGFKTDQGRIIDSTGALALEEVPKRLVVIGGGYIGLELGMVYAKLGSKVTVVEALPSILASMDKDCVAVVARKLKKMGVEVMTEAKAKSWEDKGDRAVLTVELKDGKPATTRSATSSAA